MENEADRNRLDAGDIDTGGGDLVVGSKTVNHYYGAAPAQQPNAGSDATRSDSQVLYTLLSGKYFDLNDLQDVCFKLEIDWDSLAGETKVAKARELIRHCEKYDALAQLKQVMRDARPNLREQLA
jgi:hypothetical protein